MDIEALACPECGSDEETGWSENTKYDDLFLNSDWEYHADHNVKGSNRWLKYTVIIALTITLSAFVSVTIPGGIYLIPLILIGAGLAYFVVDILPKMRRRKEKELFDTLLIRARGDAAMVERWISYERRRTPDADEVDLMEAALYRWERDNM